MEADTFARINAYHEALRALHEALKRDLAERRVHLSMSMHLALADANVAEAELVLAQIEEVDRLDKQAVALTDSGFEAAIIAVSQEMRRRTQ